jgi:hypothetical protein
MNVHDRQYTTAICSLSEGIDRIIERYYIFTMLKAAPAQPTAALAGFTPQTPRQFRAAELTADPASGIIQFPSCIFYFPVQFQKKICHRLRRSLPRFFRRC